MKFPCEACDGCGQTTPDHPNDPDGRAYRCEACDGAGERDATPSDLDGKLARHAWLDGMLSYNRVNDTLTLESDDGVVVLNLLPGHVEIVE